MKSLIYLFPLFLLNLVFGQSNYIHEIYHPQGGRIGEGVMEPAKGEGFWLLTQNQGLPVYAGLLRVNKEANYTLFKEIRYPGNFLLANRLLPTRAGNLLYLTSVTDSVTSSFYPLITLMDSTGTQIWNTALSDTGGIYATHAIQTPDGGFIVGGLRGQALDQDMYLAKFDSTGVPLWNHIYGTENIDGLDGMLSLANGDILLYGRNQPGFSPSAMVMRLDSIGNILWVASHTPDLFPWFKGAVELATGEIVLTVFLTFNNFDARPGYIRIGANGDLHASRVYFNGNSLDFIPEDLVQASDGTFYIPMNDGTFSQNPPTNAMLHLDSIGGVLDAVRIQPYTSQNDFPLLFNAVWGEDDALYFGGGMDRANGDKGFLFRSQH